jgi:hypothetical protein
MPDHSTPMDTPRHTRLVDGIAVSLAGEAVIGRSGASVGVALWWEWRLGGSGASVGVAARCIESE